mgnify:CR=1 FL=1
MGDFYLESPPLRTRSEALAIQQLAVEEGLDARVVRRYAHGAGWEYVVVVEDLEREAAEQAAESLAAQGGRGITVYRREGAEGTRVGGVDTESKGPAGLDPTEPALAVELGAELPTASTILERAVRALGGREGGISAVAASDFLRFSYERTLTYEGVELVAHHLLLRSPTGLRLEVHGKEGVRDSISVVGPGGAWVEADGAVVERDAERVAEVLDAFGPEQLLAYPLEFARLVDTEPAYRLLRTQGLEPFEGSDCWRLEYTGPEVDGTMTLMVDGSSWQVASVGFTTDSGKVRYLFSDYRELDTGLVTPFHVALERNGALVESLTVEELSLPSELPDELFARASEGP